MNVWEALETGDAEALRAVLRQDPQAAGSRDRDGVPLSLRALYLGRRDLAELVLAANPPVDGFIAAAFDLTDQLRELLIVDRDLPARRAGDGFTALHLAAFFGAERAAAMLLDAGADPAAVADNATAVQPLHSAVAGKAVGIARLLLERGADPNARQERGFTPLHGAAQAGSEPLVRLLLEHGTNPDVTNDEGVTPLELAERGNHQVAALLLRKVSRDRHPR
jgi:uncharacterized protein